ncbi:WD40 repeat-like protein [Glonium stellatum]|uniref:WD40 repeat-like protein n=1 Tax=Glonium stellatum TaxID=574774 RepID=A0A8E2EMU7_9PEZI|nr:WD40 repeat-like protein [Glonium stellatum]
MDIHRSRFVPYPPSAINALAFSHSTNEPSTGDDPSYLRLAIGRANGNIEIWNPLKGLWVHERTFSGGKDRSVEGLAWIQEPGEESAQSHFTAGHLRLFSIGYSSSVTEWDLVTGLPLRYSSGNHSEVWCLAAQPQWQPLSKKKKSKRALILREGEFRGQNLVVGCADGTLAILSTADGGLRFQNYLSRSTTKKARVLSVTYQDRDIVVAGFADSTIRVFDSRSGEALRNISLGAGPVGGPKEILVWKVKCLPNGDIVSGDSTGEVRFYDGKNYSQLQRISGHEADILDLVVTRDGKYVYSGGMDQRTTLYKLMDLSGGKRKWGKVMHKRYHDHDVKAMATYEGRAMSIVVSGGIDTHPILVPIREFGKQLNRTLSALPQVPPLTSAPTSRLLVSWWDSEVRIWRVQRQSTAEKPKIVARLALRGEENITSASISKDGTILAVSTAAGVKLFHLTKPKNKAENGLRVRKVECSQTPGARLVQLSADGKWLAIITHTDKVILARLNRSENNAKSLEVISQLITLRRLPRKLRKQDPLSGLSGNYYRTITHAQFSEDGRVLVVGDLAGYLDTWVLEGHEDSTAPVVDVGGVASSSSSSESEDSGVEEGLVRRPITIMGQHWVRNPSGHLLPKLDSMPLILSFRPTQPAKSRPQPNGNPAVHSTRQNPHARSHDLPEGEYRLLAVTAQHQIYEFDVLHGHLSEWSRRNPTANFPSSFHLVKDRVMGCIWDTHQGHQRFWLYGSTWLFMFDVSQDFPLSGAINGENMANGKLVDGQTPSKKRKRQPDDDSPRKKNSGAGDAIPQTQLLGPSRSMRKFTSGKSDESTWIHLDARSSAPESDGEPESTDLGLSSLRRGLRQEKDSDSGNGEEKLSKPASGTVNAQADKTGSPKKDRQLERKSEQDVAVKKHGRSENWWHTFKYRPILGIVPIGDRSKPLEVVLVERPPWDLDLPPRFVGSHEREE